MKRTKLLTLLALTMTVGSATATGPAINSMTVQAYMALGSGSPVSDGTYNIAFAVCQNGAAIWGKTYSVSTSGGLFTQSLSGTGTDLTSLPVAVDAAGCTGMRAVWTGTTLNPALLDASPSGAIDIRLYSVSVIDSKNPQFDIAVNSVPTSYISSLANGVVAGNVTFAMLASALTAGTGPASGANIIPITDGSGLIDVGFIPNLPASRITSGSVAVGNGGTGSATGSITGTAGQDITYASAAAQATIIGNNTSTSTLTLRSGTGGITQTVTGTTGNISLTAGSASGDLLLTPGTTSGAVTIGSGTSTGASSFGNAGAGAVTTIAGGTGGIAATVTGTTGDITLTAGSTGGSIYLTPGSAGIFRINRGGVNMVNGTGSITMNAPSNPTSYSLTLPSTAGSANQYLMTDGAGTTSWSQVNLAGTGITGTLPLSNGGTGGTDAATARSSMSAAVSGANGDITSLTAVTSVASSAGLTLSSAAAGTTTLGDNTGAATTAIRSGTGGITAAVTGTTGNVALTAGSTSGSISVTPGATSGTFTGTKTYQGGVQAITTLTGANQTLALDGSEVVTITATSGAGATTVQTLTGCNSGLYPNGGKVTLVVIGNSGAGTVGFVDTTVATATPDLMTLNAAANLVSGAANGVGRGVSLTLMCLNFVGVKKWVEVGRSANSN